MYSTHAPMGNVCSPDLANDSPPDPPTFGQLCRLEPRLDYLRRSVERFASRAGRKGRRCGNAAWVKPGGFRHLLALIVGPDGTAADPAARTRHALDLAGRELRKRLPPCSGCTCTDPITL